MRGASEVGRWTGRLTSVALFAVLVLTGIHGSASVAAPAGAIASCPASIGAALQHTSGCGMQRDGDSVKALRAQAFEEPPERETAGTDLPLFAPVEQPRRPPRPVRSRSPSRITSSHPRPPVTTRDARPRHERRAEKPGPVPRKKSAIPPVGGFSAVPLVTVPHVGTVPTPTWSVHGRAAHPPRRSGAGRTAACPLVGTECLLRAGAGPRHRVRMGAGALERGQRGGRDLRELRLDQSPRPRHRPARHHPVLADAPTGRGRRSTRAHLLRALLQSGRPGARPLHQRLRRLRRRHAGPGPRRQPAAALRLLGRHHDPQLPADRSQARAAGRPARRQPGPHRHHRRRPGHADRVHHARRVRRHVPLVADRRGRCPAGWRVPGHGAGADPCRRHLQVGDLPGQLLVAGGDGRPDPGERVPALGGHGQGRRLPDRVCSPRSSR